MSAHPPLADGWIDRPHLRCDLGDVQLESGEVLEDAFVSYVIHGDPSQLAERAILVDTAIGSTHHRLDFLIGAGAVLDTSRYCVVVVDALGNGLSSSPSNSRSQPETSFPRFTIRDMVETQCRLVERLGVQKLTAVMGASMGGMQAMQWAVSRPDMMAGVVAMTPMARTTRWSQLVNEMSRRALFEDSSCRSPRSRQDAMKLWGPLTQLVMSRSPEILEEFESHEALMTSLERSAGFLTAHGPDPFDWCYQSWAYDAHDVGTTPGFHGDTAAALRSIKAQTLVMAPDYDLYNPPFAAEGICAVSDRAQFVRLPGRHGHACATGEFQEPTTILKQAIREFLIQLEG